MNRKLEKAVYKLGKWLQKSVKAHQRGWLSFTCMVIPSTENTSDKPYSFRVNYFLILFLFFIPILLVGSIFLVKENAIAQQAKQSLESRYVTLSLLEGQIEQKQVLLVSLQNKQAELAELSYGGIDWQSQLQPYQLANILFLSDGEEGRTGKNRPSLNNQLETEASASSTSVSSGNSNSNSSTVGALLGRIETIANETTIYLVNEARPQLYATYQKSLLYASFPLGWALKGKAGVLTSGYGYRTDPLTFQREFHYGTDFAGAVGTPIIATAHGRVFEASSHGTEGYGRYVKIRHGFGFVTLYAHCSAILVRSGDWIERGQVIGYLGATGRVTGPHLHYEVRLGPSENIDSDPFVRLQ